MAKRNSSDRPSVINDTLVIIEPGIYNNVEQMQDVRSKFPARLIYTGQVTGKLYIWNQAGSVVSVHSDDVPELLTKKIGEGSCCGASQRGNLLFELI